MPEENLTPKIKIVFYRLRELRVDQTFIHLLLIILKPPIEDSGKRVGFNRALASHILLSRLHVELDATNPRTVLSAVVLLLHQQEELIKPIQRRIVFFLVVRNGLQEADHGDTAFMLQKVAH